MNNKTNPKGSVLIFSTHYAEILDEFDRLDNKHISLKESIIKTNGSRYED